jgi:hypothetical protein
MSHPSADCSFITQRSWQKKNIFLSGAGSQATGCQGLNESGDHDGGLASSIESQTFLSLSLDDPVLLLLSSPVFP